MKYYLKKMEKASFYCTETEERKAMFESELQQVTGDDTNTADYIRACVKHINIDLGKKDYRRAFSQFVMCIERLNETEKRLLITYYKEMMFDRTCGLWW